MLDEFNLSPLSCTYALSAARTMSDTLIRASFRCIAAAGGVRCALAMSLAVLGLGASSLPAVAQSGKPSCEEACAKRCAQKELAPGLYRMECEIHCVPICYANRENNAATHGGGRSKSRR